jgi:hypothetical protein
MIKIQMEVVKETARFTVSVRAQSIQQAKAIVGHYYPASEPRVVFPIEPESFFVNDPAARPELVALEGPQALPVRSGSRDGTTRAIRGMANGPALPEHRRAQRAARRPGQEQEDIAEVYEDTQKSLGVVAVRCTGEKLKKRRV